MALSLLSHNSTEIQTLFDPLRISLDYTCSSDQMEFSPLGTVNNNLQNRNYIDIHPNPIQGNRNNYNEYDQVISFVDSPPNSKESWTEVPQSQEQLTEQQENQQQQQQQAFVLNSCRKRRMDWEALDINQDVPDSCPNDAKIPILQTKEKENKKLEGRESWSDDIDFDVNGEFSNNGYLANETFLTLSSALTVLKQEVTSPNSDQNKNCKNLRKNENKINGNCADKQKLVVERAVVVNPTSVCNFQQQQKQQSPTQMQLNNLDQNMNGNENSTTNSAEIVKSDQQVDDYKFQYILAAATSIATKSNEETLTYLNQGQSYEIKLKKIGDLSFYRDKILKSIIKICFHERRLQYMEREQMQQWQASRPGERIIDVDVPLSYGLCHVSQPLNLLNTVEILWDPMKEVGVYIKVNCISTEFTPKKHGGEKGVPFRIQIETYLENNNTNDNTTIIKPIHAAACQIKVFKLKGADRKHKQDREKIQKRSATEQEKYQPSYECTILNDIPSDSIVSQRCYSPEYSKPTVSPLIQNSPVHISKYDTVVPFPNNPSPVVISNVTSTKATNFKQMDQNLVSPQQIDVDDFDAMITKESSTIQVAQWLTYHRLGSYVGTFTHFSGSDVLRMSKEDLIQICGLADGIRMFNTLHTKAITPRLTIYVSLDGTSYNAVYLISNTVKELIQKLSKLPGFFELCANKLNGNGIESNTFPGWGLNSKYSRKETNIYDLISSKFAIYVNGPNGIQVLVTDEVLNNIKDDSLFTIEFQNKSKILMKANYKNETN